MRGREAKSVDTLPLPGMTNAIVAQKRATVAHSAEMLKPLADISARAGRMERAAILRYGWQPATMARLNPSKTTDTIKQPLQPGGLSLWPALDPCHEATLAGLVERVGEGGSANHLV